MCVTKTDHINIIIFNKFKFVVHEKHMRKQRNCLCRLDINVLMIKALESACSDR